MEPANKKLLMEMVDVLRDPAPEEAYQLLCNYIEEVGEYNVDYDTRELFESATAAPVIPDAKPEEGAYVQPFTLQLESREHSACLWVCVGRASPLTTHLQPKSTLLIRSLQMLSLK